MKNKQPLIALLSAAVLLAASTVSFACACCSDRGQYDVSVGALAKYQVELLKDMHFGATPELYLPDADAIIGMEDLGLGDLSLIDAYTHNTWRLTIKSTTGKMGTLILPRPARVTLKKIDLHDREEGEPALYKEWSFEGTVASGSGVFGRGIIRPTKYTLLFQGRGNNCDNAEDFTHWRLEVKGRKASYAFFGPMKAGPAT